MLYALSVHTDTGNATGLARGQVVHPIRRLIIPDIGRARPTVASAVQAFVVVAVVAPLPFIVGGSAACTPVAILVSALIAIVLAHHAFAKVGAVRRLAAAHHCQREHAHQSKPITHKHLPGSLSAVM
jgi:hypothetical protein